MEDVENNIPLKNNSEYDPNHTLIATFSNSNDVNNFCNRYNHSNNYNGLKIGQTIKINNSGYDTNLVINGRDDIWYIAGFDCECNQVAADGSVYNNGYGICLIPKRYAISGVAFHNSNNENVGYVGSDMHKTILPNWVNSYLKSKLGNHLINRNVLLSNQIGNEPGAGSSSYTWTTSYATLMSGCQLTGLKSSFASKYDDGEANYKIPLFNYIDFTDRTNKRYWMRGMIIYGNKYRAITRSDKGYYTPGMAYALFSDDNLTETDNFIRPMIYIR